MRTTIELSDELVSQAKSVLGGPTLRAMIEESLRSAIARRLREEMRRAIRDGEVLLDTSDEELAALRRDRDYQ
ncbi:MAG: hypothetical protein EPO26_14995 [Chloroflexota bacterium]|nr:MAG: hypothetical protein EPO26_14995 [Chloroflexota bacterium]